MIEKAIASVSATVEAKLLVRLAEQRGDFPPPAAAAFPSHDRILHTLR